MDTDNTPPLPPYRPPPSLAKGRRFSAYKRPFSSTSSIGNECSVIRKEVLQLYRSEKLPSIYQHTTFGQAIDKTDRSFIDLSFDQERPKKAINAVDWDDDLDPNKPLNWPLWKKNLNIGCIFLMCIISPFTSSVFAPAIPDLMLSFRTTDPYLSSFVLSIYVLSYAIGPLLISPLSELVGRVPLYHFCNTLFSISTVLCGRTTSLRGLAAARLFAGMGGSSVFALAPSSIADVFEKEKHGAAMALIAIGYNLGPAISPTAGSYINDAWGWRWIFYISGGIGTMVTLVNFVGLSETYEPVLLRRKASRLRKRFSNSELRSRFDFDVHATRKKILWKAMLMPIRMLLCSRTILLTSSLTAVAYGFMYILYTTLPTTFLVTYAWSPKRVGLAYLGTAIGALVGMIAGAKISDGVVKRRAAKGDMKPENRLLPMCFFWPCVGVGLVVYAWTAQNAVHWSVPLMGTAVFGAGAMSAIFFTGTYILDAYPTHSASGTAASILFRSILGGLAPLFANKLYERFDVGWTFSLLAFIALAVAPMPWIAYRFGERLRRRENFGGDEVKNGVGDVS